jgi:hypothetical protein
MAREFDIAKKDKCASQQLIINSDSTDYELSRKDNVMRNKADLLNANHIYLFISNLQLQKHF